MATQNIRLGLTGGIGSGKSTVATMITSFGAAMIDADAISKRLTASNGEAISTIKEQFGELFINKDGSLNRNHMRDLIFSDSDAKRRLEKIIHPLVKIEIERQDQLAVSLGKRLIVYDIPLLVESSNWRPVLDNVLVTDCLEQTQIDRVILRNGLKAEEIQKIIASQTSRKIRNSAADMLIFNDSISIEQLRQQVKQVSQHFGL
jgi:dephospho-CoA kinase